MSEKEKTKKVDVLDENYRKQAPLNWFTPGEEEPACGGSENHLDTPSKEESSTLDLIKQKNSYIKGSPVEIKGKRSQGESTNQFSAAYTSTGTKQTNKPTLEEEKERKKERKLFFLVSNLLHNVPLPVEMKVDLLQFGSKVPDILLEEWIRAAQNEASPRRNGKLQRALWKSMVLYIISVKEKKPDQQLMLQTASGTSLISHLCPRTLRGREEKNCRTCQNRYFCATYG